MAVSATVLEPTPHSRPRLAVANLQIEGPDDLENCLEAAPVAAVFVVTLLPLRQALLITDVMAAMRSVEATAAATVSTEL